MLLSLVDFYFDIVVFGNRIFGSDLRLVLSVFGSLEFLIMIIWSIFLLRSGFGIDIDSVVRFRFDFDVGLDEGLIDREVMLKRYVVKSVYGMKNIFFKLRFVNELEGNEEKWGLYDLVSFYDFVKFKWVVVGLCFFVVFFLYWFFLVGRGEFWGWWWIV